MNQLELAALQTSISHLARTLYCLFLRPQVSQNDNTAIINNKSILALLNNKETCVTKGREINNLFSELLNVGLVEFENEHLISASLHKKKVRLPLVHLPQTLEDPSLHSSFQSMHLNWRPHESVFNDLCQLVGLIDKIYNADELGEFIAYWIGRIDTQCTEYQWTQKLVIYLKQRRLTKPFSSQQTRAGHQYVTPKSGIEFDDNVKRLVEQYKEQIE